MQIPTFELFKIQISTNFPQWIGVMCCIKKFNKCTRKTTWTKIGTFQGHDYGPNFILVGVGFSQLSLV